MTSTFRSLSHVAIIMDGNGRWATSRGVPRLEGHRAGAAALRRTVEAAIEERIAVLTVYAFSSDNWRRPRTEVAALMLLFRQFLTEEAAECARRGVRLSMIGRRDRLPGFLLPLIEQAEAATAGGGRLHLRLAIDYSARDAIVRAGEQARTREAFSTRLGPDVDLLIRTAGERRLSDFLLWESAYAELYFTATLWPDFGAPDLAEAVADFRKRTRKFGALPAA
ncbi:MAG: polyprenyl diphosphate synthase [Bryobacteraceae bacterium]|nr:polyprenyl diphosphate synthase [Bryobacteraceae bacterium]